MLLTGFTVESIYRGKMETSYVGINSASFPEEQFKSLQQGQKYLVFLEPTQDSMKALKLGDGAHYYFNALSRDEVKAIVALK